QELDEEEEKQPDLTMAADLPTYMKEYTHLFNKTNFDRLPNHMQWDHEIKLMENTPSELQAKIYPMTLKEEEELNAFMDENLKSGRIQVLKSQTLNSKSETAKSSGTTTPPTCSNTPNERMSGDSVWLEASNIMTNCPSKKLDYQRCGPFPISKVIGNGAYWLKIPPQWVIHDVFNEVLLSLVRKPEFLIQQQPPPPPLDLINAEEEWEVEKIRGH
ncbi:hypothetical protein AN958_08596, partial [Leucoagaricus sp. SymC.cos]